MSYYNPIVSNFSLAAGATVELYTCPPGKSHAMIDLSILKSITTGSSRIALALSSSANPGTLTSVDYFMDDLDLVGAENLAEMTGIIVGTGEHLYAKNVTGEMVFIRAQGVESSSSKVVKAGRLAAGAVNSTSLTQIFTNTWSNVAYLATSLTLYNTANANAQVQVYSTQSGSPAPSEKIVDVALAPDKTLIIENHLLKPNEKIFVQSSVAGFEHFLVGFAMGN